jgi:hypothetical protein
MFGSKSKSSMPQRLEPAACNLDLSGAGVENSNPRVDENG